MFRKLGEALGFNSDRRRANTRQAQMNAMQSNGRTMSMAYQLENNQPKTEFELFMDAFDETIVDGVNAVRSSVSFVTNLLDDSKKSLSTSFSALKDWGMDRFSSIRSGFSNFFSNNSKKPSPSSQMDNYARLAQFVTTTPGVGATIIGGNEDSQSNYVRFMMDVPATDHPISRFNKRLKKGHVRMPFEITDSNAIDSLDPFASARPISSREFHGSNELCWRYGELKALYSGDVISSSDDFRAMFGKIPALKNRYELVLRNLKSRLVGADKSDEGLDDYFASVKSIMMNVYRLDEAEVAEFMICFAKTEHFQSQIVNKSSVDSFGPGYQLNVEGQNTGLNIPSEIEEESNEAGRLVNKLRFGITGGSQLISLIDTPQTEVTEDSVMFRLSDYAGRSFNQLKTYIEENAESFSNESTRYQALLDLNYLLLEKGVSSSHVSTFLNKFVQSPFVQNEDNQEENLPELEVELVADESGEFIDEPISDEFVPEDLPELEVELVADESGEFIDEPISDEFAPEDLSDVEEKVVWESMSEGSEVLEPATIDNGSLGLLDLDPLNIGPVATGEEVFVDDDSKLFDPVRSFEQIPGGSIVSLSDISSEAFEDHFPFNVVDFEKVEVEGVGLSEPTENYHTPIPQVFETDLEATVVGCNDEELDSRVFLAIMEDKLESGEDLDQDEFRRILSMASSNAELSKEIEILRERIERLESGKGTTLERVDRLERRDEDTTSILDEVEERVGNLERVVVDAVPANKEGNNVVATFVGSLEGVVAEVFPDNNDDDDFPMPFRPAQDTQDAGNIVTQFGREGHITKRTRAIGLGETSFPTLVKSPEEN